MHACADLMEDINLWLIDGSADGACCNESTLTVKARILL